MRHRIFRKYFKYFQIGIVRINNASDFLYLINDKNNCCALIDRREMIFYMQGFALVGLGGAANRLKVAERAGYALA